MVNIKRQTKFLLENGHLSDNGIAIYTEALIDDSKFVLIPEQVLAHTEECIECKKHIIETYELLKNEEIVVHPVLQQKNEKKVFFKFPLSQNTFKQNSRNYQVIAIAASLVIILALYFLLVFQVKPEGDKLFKRYFEPYPDVISMKGEVSPKDELFKSGMYYYGLKKYDTAIIIFNSILKEDSTNETVNFYTGIAYLGLGKSKEATGIFLDMDKNEGIFNQQVKWYFSLSLILHHDFKGAIPFLEDLKKENGYYSEKARNLLSKID